MKLEQFIRNLTTAVNRDPKLLNKDIRGLDSAGDEYLLNDEVPKYNEDNDAVYFGVELL